MARYHARFLNRSEISYFTELQFPDNDSECLWEERQYSLCG